MIPGLAQSAGRVDAYEVSRSYAYRLIKQLNAELREKGYMTIAGRVNRQYFKERLYGTSDQKECESRVNAQG